MEDFLQNLIIGIMGSPTVDAGYMQYLQNMPQQFMDRMWPCPENIDSFIAWIVALIPGYLIYTYAGRVAKEKHVSPYPLWIHCYMMSIDTIGVITFAYLAFTYNFYWFFCLQCVLLAIWLRMEFKSIQAGLNNRDELQQEFGALRKGSITRKEAIPYCIGIYVVGFMLNAWGMSLFGGFANMGIWIIYAFTNYVYAIFTWRFWDARAAQVGVRKYNSVGLAAVLVFTMFISWCPFISWYWVVSPFFHQPWFYLVGIAATAVAVYNLIRVRKLPDWNYGDPLPGEKDQAGKQELPTSASAE